MPYTIELQAALDAARLAGRRIMELYATFTAIPDAQVNITTQADYDSQELILQALSARFPGDAFVAEEKTPTLAALSRDGPRRWIIDPIDGTRGFAQKSDEFSVMIGLVEGSEVVVGVVLEPAKDRETTRLACIVQPDQHEVAGVGHHRLMTRLVPAADLPFEARLTLRPHHEADIGRRRPAQSDQVR